MTDTRVVLVDASRGGIRRGERLELARTVAQAIGASASDRLGLAPTHGSGPGMARTRLTAWRRASRPGYVKVIWDLRVEPGPDSGTTLSMTTRFVSTDHSSRERLWAAWGVVGPVSAALSKRALAAVKRYAEEPGVLPRRQAPVLALAA